MRSILLLVILFCGGVGYGQGSGFSFSYTGPSQIIVGQDCIAPLEWGHPNTPTASSNLPGGMIVSFEIYSISGGYQIGDDVGGGTVVTVFYQAIDNFGNTALFGFTITFIDLIPPVFDPLSLPPNLTVNCTGDFPIAQVEVSDNCDEQDIVLTVTFTETNTAMPCTGGLITRKWVADDDLGNFATFIQTITVLPDTTPPVIANNLVNGSAPCTNAMSQYSAWLTAQRAAFSATDSGCGVMTLSDNAPSPAIITSFCGEIVVTFSAKDNCNNISTVQRTFTVFNSIPPVIDNPAADAMGNCSQANIQQLFNSWIGSHGGATATDDCSSVLWSTFPPSPSLSDTCNAAIQVMFIAGDGCGNFDTTSASFFVTDETPPVFTMDPSSLVLSCTATTIDSLLMDWLIKSGKSKATDLCTSEGNLVKGYRLGGIEHTLEEVLNAWQDSLVAGCTDNVIINGIGISNVLAYLAVEFTYDDVCGNETGKTGYFGITDNGRPQFVTMPSDTSLTCAEGGNWENAFLDWYNSAGGATYMDACSDVDIIANITADSALQILTAALDTACNQGAGVTIQFTLVDACGNLSLSMPSVSFSLTDTIAPVLTSPASDFIASCSMNGQQQINAWLDTLGGASASDGCGSLIWTFSWIDTSGQTLTGMPGTGPYPQLTTLDCSGGLEVIFTAADACQNSVSDTAIFSIIDTLPPDILIPDDSIHLACLAPIPSDTPQVTDACNGVIMISFQDVAGIDSCGGLPEIVIRTWTATDECGNGASAQITYFRIDTLAPTFDLPMDTVASCSVDTSMLLNLQDNCDPNPSVFSEDVLSGAVCEQMLNRTWTVTDACGNSATAVQTFDLSDVSPPVIGYSPGNFIYVCGSGNAQDSYEQWMDSVVVTDGCSEPGFFIAMPGSYILEDTSTWPGTPLPDSIFLSCTDDVMIIGDLVAFDACGNAIVEEVSFTVNDTTAPIINCPAVMQVEPDTALCNGLVQLVAPAIEEICYPSDVSLVLLINGGADIILDSTGMLDTILPVGIHTALWIATDCKGNRGTCMTVIEIIDENAITLSCPADTLLYTNANTCTDSLWVYPPQSTLGLCAQGVVELRFEIIGNAEPDSMPFSSVNDSILVTFSSGIHQVLLIARDSTGDIDTCIYSIELRDTIDPEIVCQTDTVFLHPSGLDTVDLSSTTLVLSSTDNCNIQNIVIDPPAVNCSNAGQTLDISVIAFDDSGNTDSCMTTLVVTTQVLMPQWEKGLCDDTLRLFANMPPGPATNYTFNWSGPNGFVSMEENPVIPDSDSSFSGTYTLVVQSESGCVSSGSVEIEIQDLVSPQISAAEDTFCSGELIELTTQNYTGDVTYLWNQITPAGDTLIVTTQVPSLEFALDSAGHYSFFAIVIQDTCASAPGPATDIFIVPVPIAEIAANTGFFCEDDTLFLAPATVIDSLIYLWTGPGGFSSNDPEPPGIPVIEIDSPAVYYLIVSNQFCNSLIDSIEILIQETPATPVIDGDSLACEGGNFLLNASTPGDEYLWVDPLENTFLTTENTLTISPAETNHGGPWHVIAFMNGCQSDTSDAFTVRVDSAIDVQIIAPAIACEGESITLSVSPSVTGTFAWSGPGGFASDEASPVTVALAGIYTVFVQTETGCEAMDSASIEVNVLPVVTGLFHDAGSCVDGTTDVHLWAETEPVSDGSYVFQWTGPAGFASQDSSPVIQNFNSSLNGVYSLIITHGACTTDTFSLSIEVVDSPGPPEIIGQTTYCFGDTIVLSIGAPVPGGVYTWSYADTSIVIPSPGMITIPGADDDFSGSFTVDVFIEGCISAQSSVSVQVNPFLSSPVITSPALACEGDSLVLTSDAPAGAVVHWSGPNGFTSNEFSPVLFPVLLENAGSYTASYTLNGCPSDTSAAFFIDVLSTIMPPVLLADVASVCIDDPVPLILCIDEASATQGGSYTWFLNDNSILSGPLTDSCIAVDGALLQEGSNFITAISSLQGCRSDTSTALLLLGDAFPEQNADAGIDMEYCPDEPVILDASEPAPSTGVWSATSSIVVFGDNTNPNTTVSGLPPGEYHLTWTLSFASCDNYSTDSVLITVIPAPEVLPDTVLVPFGQTREFNVINNDSINGIAFTLEIVSSPLKGKALHAGNGVFRYTPNIGFVGTDMLVYRICSTDCPDECSEAVVVLRVGDEDDCFTPTLFTPNEDGINDRLIFPCLETELYPDNKLIVFNEWGDAVFTAAPYQNDWEGTFSGEALPVGTYFYIMDFGDGSDAKKSFLVLEK